jgi:ferredoxin-NADP reductase
MSAQALSSESQPRGRAIPSVPPAANPRFVPVQVIGRAQAANDAVTFWLAAPGTTRAPMPYLPGQFITLTFTPPAQAGKHMPTLYRSYSLCGDGDPQQPWEITVKRQRAGLVSTFLYDHIRTGTLLQASRPGGNFTLPASLDSNTRLVFVAAGSGITPLYGMLRAVARLDPAVRPQVHLHYAYHSPADAIYTRELAQLDPQRRWLWQWHYRSDQRQRLAPLHVMVRLQDVGIEPARAHWYVCGPDALKRNLLAAAQRSGVPATQLHAEVFSSPGTSAMVDDEAGSGTARRAVTRLPATPAAPAGPATIRIAESGAVLDVRPRETILEALERNGYEPDFSCRSGSCGTCMLRMVAGKVSPPVGDVNNVLSPAERAEGYVLSCTARPVGQVTLALAGTHAAAMPTPAAPLSPAAQAGGGAASATRSPSPRSLLQRRLRLGVAAASIALFASVWGLTSHRVAASASTPGISLPSLPNLLPSDSSDDGSGGASSSSSSSSSSSNGSSWFSPQPSLNQPSSGTGTS